jgi:23S rRNA (guanosine2251-2'-O)-methyltransferase
MKKHWPRPYHPDSSGAPANGDSAPLPPQRRGKQWRQDAHHGHQGARGEIIFGVEPVRELIAASPVMVRLLYIKAGAQSRFTREIDAVRASGGQVVSAQDDALVRMAGAEARHQGIVAAIREYPYAPLEGVIDEKPDPLILVDGVTDPRNLGAILRSAECAGARAVVLARDRTVGITPAAVKASAGAWVHLKIARCGNVAQTIEALKAQGYWIAALAPEGNTSIYDIDATRRFALVLGSEDYGIREIIKKTADFIVRIPMHGRVGSLNVSVAAAVTLFELARQRENTGKPASV